MLLRWLYSGGLKIRLSGIRSTFKGQENGSRNYKRYDSFERGIHSWPFGFGHCRFGCYVGYVLEFGGQVSGKDNGYPEEPIVFQNGDGDGCYRGNGGIESRRQVGRQYYRCHSERYSRLCAGTTVGQA